MIKNEVAQGNLTLSTWQAVACDVLNAVVLTQKLTLAKLFVLKGPTHVPHHKNVQHR